MTDIIYNFSLKIFELLQGFLTFCWNLVTSGALRILADHFIGFVIIMCIICTCIDEILYYKRTGKHNLLIIVLLSAWKLINSGIERITALLEEKGIEFPLIFKDKEQKTIEQKKEQSAQNEQHTIRYKDPVREEAAPVIPNDIFQKTSSAEEISPDMPAEKPLNASSEGVFRNDGAYIVTNPQNIMVPKDGSLERISGVPAKDESVVKDNA